MVAHGIELNGVSFRIGDFCLEDLSLAIPRGEYFVLTGANGAGKTVVTKLIVGLYRPIAGKIHIADRPVTDLPPWERNVGYVPQDGILFPNRTVRKNIEFGLEVRHLPKEEIDRETQRVSALMRIEHLLDRRPLGLSGGERQKASLARAMVFKPSILLLDEPVSAIDEDTRDDLCRELRRVHQETGITTLHISHNRRETELVADSVGVLKNGRVEVGRPGASITTA